MHYFPGGQVRTIQGEATEPIALQLSCSSSQLSNAAKGFAKLPAQQLSPARPWSSSAEQFPFLGLQYLIIRPK